MSSPRFFVMQARTRRKDSRRVAGHNRGSLENTMDGWMYQGEEDRRTLPLVPLRPGLAGRRHQSGARSLASHIMDPTLNTLGFRGFRGERPVYCTCFRPGFSARIKKAGRYSFNRFCFLVNQRRCKFSFDARVEYLNRGSPCTCNKLSRSFELSQRPIQEIQANTLRFR